jgi:hypothetical protein
MNTGQRALARLANAPRRSACIDDQRVNHGVSLIILLPAFGLRNPPAQSNFPSGPKNG